MREKLLIPNTIEELKKNLNESDERTKFISGGTDMILNLKKNGFEGITLIDLSGISELKYIEEKDEKIFIGAGTTLSEISENSIIKKYAKLLEKAADSVGSTQIRNAATIGGNIANSFAGADLIPPLIAMETELLLLGKYGKKRIVKIEDFLLENRKNILEIGEMVLEVIFNKPYEFQYFGKIGSRSRVTISKLNMAANILIENNQIKCSKIVFGALGSTAFKSLKIVEFMNGKMLNDLDLCEFKKIFTLQVDEAIPNRASRIYKREAVTSLAEELYGILKMEVEV